MGLRENLITFSPNCKLIDEIEITNGQDHDLSIPEYSSLEHNIYDGNLIEIIYTSTEKSFDSCFDATGYYRHNFSFDDCLTTICQYNYVVITLNPQAKIWKNREA